MHFVDQKNGVKDIDVWTFYAEVPGEPFPARWRTVRDFGPSQFGKHPDDGPTFSGRRADLISRSLRVAVDAEPLQVIRNYLALGSSETARALASKAVVILDPEPLRGVIAWPSR